MKLENYGILGQVLLNVLVFWRAKFALNLRYIDPVTQVRVLSEDLFELRKGVWFLNTDSIPGHIGVKAIAVDETTLFVEMSQVSDTALRELIETNELRFKYDPRKRTVTSTSGVDKIKITLSKRRQHQHRCLWSVPLPASWADGSDLLIKQAISLIDLVLIEEAFDTSTADSESSAGGDVARQAEVVLRQSLNLVQELKQEQVSQMIGEQMLELNLGLTMLQSMQAVILRMTPEEIKAFLMEDISPEGQRRSLNIMHFVLTGKIKNAAKAARKEITWSQARKLAWKLINSQPGK